MQKITYKNYEIYVKNLKELHCICLAPDDVLSKSKYIVLFNSIFNFSYYGVII